MYWCRLYGDMVDDPKIGTLSDSEFRTWIELLCLATKAEDDGDTRMTPEEASWALRRNVTETLQELIDRYLVHYSETGTLVITKWGNRQKKSDSSTERVRKHRSKKEENQGCNTVETDETLRGCSSNAPEKKEKKEERERNNGAERASPSQRKNPKRPPPDPFEITDAMWEYARSKGIPDFVVESETEKFLAHHRANDSRFSNWYQAWQKWMRNYLDWNADKQPAPAPKLKEL